MFWKAYLSIQEAAVSFASRELGCSGGRGLLFQYSEGMSPIQQWTSIGFYLNHWAGMLFKSFSFLPEGEVLECFSSSVYLLSKRAPASGRLICWAMTRKRRLSGGTARLHTEGTTAKEPKHCPSGPLLPLRGNRSIHAARPSGTNIPPLWDSK